MSPALLTVLLLFDALAAIGVVALIAARLQDGPLGLVVWVPVGGWVVGYGAGCVTGSGTLQTWPGVQLVTDEWVVLVTSALSGSCLSAATGWVLARAYFRRTEPPQTPTENVSPEEHAPSNSRRLAKAIMLAFILVVVVMECAGGAGLVQWFMNQAPA